MAGYPDSENMWTKIGTMEKEIPNTNKYPNNRSQYTIQVTDKVFKLRKNPGYKGQLAIPRDLQEDLKELQAAE